jgi:hypothetical protein
MASITASAVITMTGISGSHGAAARVHDIPENLPSPLRRRRDTRIRSEQVEATRPVNLALNR